MPKIRTLSLLVLTLALLPLGSAQEDPIPANPPAAATEPASPPTAPELRIDEAIKALKELPSASAELNVVADMLNQNFRLKGQYLKGPNHRVALFLELIGLADARGTMIQVCDGVTLWNYQQILDDKACSKLMMKPVLDTLNKPECDAEFRDLILSGMGFVGPEALLSGLRKTFVFDTVREMEFEGKSVYVFGGSWKNTQVPIGPNGMTFNPLATLPPYIPSLVYLYLGKADNWPYQVEFQGRIPSAMEQKKDTRDYGPDGRPTGRKVTGPAGRPSKLILTYSNVILNAEIPIQKFGFAPPDGVKASDLTDRTVTRLDQLIVDQAARKKAEASKAAPAVEGSLPAPGPSAESTAAPLPGLAPR